MVTDDYRSLRSEEGHKEACQLYRLDDYWI